VTWQWCHHGTQHCQVSKKIFTHLNAWSIAMEHAKNYEIKCKIIWNIRTKPVAPFSGQCYLRVLSIKVLQGSVGTCENYGRILIDYFTANLLQSVVVKEFWQDAQLSQRDHAAVCVIVFAKSRTLELGDNILRTL